MMVKVCGMRDPENIRAVEQAGADLLGFICYAPSPRFVGSSAPRPSRCKRVGVFVNAPECYIYNMVKELSLDYVQLHGNESPAFCRNLYQAGLRLIKAFSVSHAGILDGTQAYAPYCDYFLFDTPCASYGGSGETFDWQMLLAYRASVTFFLSGGLSPGSLNALARFSHPLWVGIDLNSGFELAPGLKDARALHTFIKRFKDIRP